MRVYKYIPVETTMELIGATLLSVDEFEKHKEYITPINGEWWLRDAGKIAGFAGYVYYDGTGEWHGDPEGSPIEDEKLIRPAVTFEAEALSEKLHMGDRFDIGETAFTVISNNMAIANKPIGEGYFDAQSNDYEQSSVKGMVEKWFASLCNK